MFFFFFYFGEPQRFHVTSVNTISGDFQYQHHKESFFCKSLTQIDVLTSLIVPCSGPADA